jgi:hypothetical protein
VLSSSGSWTSRPSPCESTPALCKAIPRTDAVIIGGSNAGQLHDRFSDLGKTVESLDASGWTISKAAVDTLLPVLAENLGQLIEYAV